jgi:hypothetical protein
MTSSNAQDANVSVEEQQCIKIRQNYVDKTTDAATAILLLRSVQASEDVLRKYMEEINALANIRLENIEDEPSRPGGSGLAEELGEGTSGGSQFVVGSLRRWRDLSPESEDESADEARLERRRGKERERDAGQRDKEKAEPKRRATPRERREMSRKRGDVSREGGA